MAQQAMEEVLETKLFNIENGIDYVMFDYKTGGAVVIKNIAAPINNIGITESNVSLDILLTNIVPILAPTKESINYRTFFF